MTRPASRNNAPAQHGPARQPDAQLSDAIATVNGRPIARQAWLNLLKRSHGLAVLQQMIALELARQAASAKGITLSDADLEKAFQQTVDEVVGPDVKQPEQKRRILQAVLARKGASLEEFRLAAYRNAYLSKLAERTVEPMLTDRAVRNEFDRLYGPKVQIRDIQVASTKKLNAALEALARGEDFAEVARRYSENVSTAPTGGLLPAFAENDETVPQALREAAFRLPVGGISAPIRIEGWYHIIKVVKRLPAEPVNFADVAEQVRQSLRQRLIREEVSRLARKLLENADVQIFDPDLARQYRQMFR